MNEYENYRKEMEGVNGTSSRIWESIQPVHIIIIFALLIFGNKLYTAGESNTILVVGGVLLAIYIFSLSKSDRTKRQIPRPIATKIAHGDLNNDIGPNGAYVSGTKIYPTGYFRDQSWDNGDGMKLFKYNIGFKITEPGKSSRDIIYQMNPFTGESKGVVEAPMGFQGDKLKDIQTIIPAAVKVETPKP